MLHSFIKPLPAVAAFALLLAVGSPAAHAAENGITVKTSEDFGQYLADSAGNPLYVFDADKPAKGGKPATSACTGKCADAWPPFSGKPAAGASGLKASLLGTIKRADGSSQTTYNGYPLYTFVRDKSTTGEPQGEGLEAFGGEWYLMQPSGDMDEEDAD
jgi:predicted lipoprotein with Yx(FWY)xxD motif